MLENNVKISDAESIILKILWESDHAMSISDILEQLKDESVSWAYTTVATFLRRMKKKQLVSFEKVDKTYYYKPTIEKMYIPSGARKYVNRYFQGSILRFLAAFTKDEQLTKQDICELKEWVDKLYDK